MLKLHTTLGHFEQSDRLQSKMFYIQVAYKIDGIKSTKDEEVDIAEIYKKETVIRTIKVLDKPETLFKFKIHANIKQDKDKKLIDKKKVQDIQNQSKPNTNLAPKKNQGKSLSKPPLANNKSMKIIRFQDTTEKQPHEFNDNHQGFAVRQKMKSMKNLPSAFKETQDKYARNEGESNKVSLQNMEKQLQQKSKQLLKIQTKHTELQLKYKDLSSKFQRLNQKYSALVIQKENDTTNRNSQTTGQSQAAKKQKEKYQKLQKQLKKLKDEQKQHNKRVQAKQSQIKSLKAQIKSLQQTNKKNESKIKELKEQSQHFQDLLLEMQTKTKNTSNNYSLQDSLKPYKQRIRILERQLQDLNEQKNFAQKQSKNKQDEIVELRQKIKSLNQQNLKSIENVANKEYEIEKLMKKVKELEENIKNNELKGNKKTAMGSDQQQDEDLQEQYPKSGNKFKSQKIIGSSSPSITQLKSQVSDLKRRLQLTQKNLQNKQALLKNFDSFSKQGRKQLEDQLQQLKKQNQKLKNKLQGGNKNQLGGLQSRMQLEKVKKQLQYKTKSQRQLLIDKSQLQTRNKALQQDVVKSKESIANILNAIHEFGDEGLIEDVTACLG